ncbi:hypothetical protein F4780DRAFT_291632 [Xylariomycetidae sp. FL0641]|nr:hypothetical protein F4780DRAFT_291632 [Xylariomycetidae sp. FL0641]
MPHLTHNTVLLLSAFLFKGPVRLGLVPRGCEVRVGSSVVLYNCMRRAVSPSVPDCNIANRLAALWYTRRAPVRSSMDTSVRGHLSARVPSARMAKRVFNGLFAELIVSISCQSCAAQESFPLVPGP